MSIRMTAMKKSYANMDPVEEIRAIRAELMREFKTLDALCAHLDQRYGAKSVPKKAKAAKRRGAPTRPARA